MINAKYDFQLTNLKRVYEDLANVFSSFFQPYYSSCIQAIAERQDKQVIAERQDTSHTSRGLLNLRPNQLCECLN